MNAHMTHEGGERLSEVRDCLFVFDVDGLDVRCAVQAELLDDKITPPILRNIRVRITGITLRLGDSPIPLPLTSHLYVAVEQKLHEKFNHGWRVENAKLFF